MTLVAEDFVSLYSLLFLRLWVYWVVNVDLEQSSITFFSYGMFDFEGLVFIIYIALIYFWMDGGKCERKKLWEGLTCRKMYTIRGLMKCVDMLNLRDLRKWTISLYLSFPLLSSQMQP